MPTSFVASERRLDAILGALGSRHASNCTRATAAAGRCSVGETSPPSQKTRARAVLERPAPQGWRTTDEQEITLRRWRGRTEIVDIEKQDTGHAFYGSFR